MARPSRHSSVEECSLRVRVVPGSTPGDGILFSNRTICLSPRYPSFLVRGSRPYSISSRIVLALLCSAALLRGSPVCIVDVDQNGHRGPYAVNMEERTDISKNTLLMPLYGCSKWRPTSWCLGALFWWHPTNIKIENQQRILLT